MRHGFLSHPGWPRVPRSLVRPALAAAAALAIVGVPALSQVQQASAFESWCWDDPVIAINGHTMRVIVGVKGSPEQVSQHIRNAQITIAVPPGVNARVIDSSSPYFPQTVAFVAGKDDWKPGKEIPVTVSVAFTSANPATVEHDETETAAQVTADTDKTLLIHGKAKDVLHHDVKFHEPEQHDQANAAKPHDD